MKLLIGSATLCQREFVRFLRQRSRIVGALGTPVVFWLLLGSGVGRTINLPGSDTPTSYLEYFFPGTVVMILLFTAIFSTISVIEDRKEGFLQAVLVAPVSRSAIVLGKISGAAILALVQALLLVVLAPFTVGAETSAIPLTAVFLMLVALGLTGLGYTIAWSLQSTQGFHAIMNLFLIPMWLLSGAVFPATGAPGWLQWIIRVNPLTYGVGLIRWSLYGPAAYTALGAPDPMLSLGIVVGFAVVMFGIALKITLRR